MREREMASTSASNMWDFLICAATINYIVQTLLPLLIYPGGRILCSYCLEDSFGPVMGFRNENVAEVTYASPKQKL